jgi:hypothetical protein
MRKLVKAIKQALQAAYGYQVRIVGGGTIRVHYSWTRKGAWDWIYCYGAWPTDIELVHGDKVTYLSIYGGKGL